MDDDPPPHSRDSGNCAAVGQGGVAATEGCRVQRAGAMA